MPSNIFLILYIYTVSNIFFSPFRCVNDGLSIIAVFQIICSIKEECWQTDRQTKKHIHFIMLQIYHQWHSTAVHVQSITQLTMKLCKPTGWHLSWLAIPAKLIYFWLFLTAPPVFSSDVICKRSSLICQTHTATWKNTGKPVQTVLIQHSDSITKNRY